MELESDVSTRGVRAGQAASEPQPWQLVALADYLPTTAHFCPSSCHTSDRHWFESSGRLDRLPWAAWCRSSTQSGSSWALISRSWH